MKNIKITVIGNSVALRKRPAQQAPNNKNYGEFLEELLNEQFDSLNFLVTNKAIGRSTVIQTYENIDHLINTFPQIFIINIGVVDASTREIPYWFSKIINSKKDNLFKEVCCSFHSRIIKKNRKIFVKLRNKKTYFSFKKFKQYYELLIKNLIKETNAEIIILPINKTNLRIENELPGSSANYLKYNNFFKDFTEKQNLNFVNLDDLDSEKHVPDGIHFSQEGNLIVAEKLKKSIIRILELG